MMGNVLFDKYRNQYSWYILEIENYICHYEQSNQHNEDVIGVLRAADDRFSYITKTLKIDIGVKSYEQRPKFNYWIHNSEVVTKSGIIIENNTPFGTGSASRSGIDYVVYNCDLSAHINHLLHEEVHMLWMSEVGEAPSILNEGIAVYVEALEGDGYKSMKDRFCNTWISAFSQQQGVLKQLTDNTFFWSKYGKLPVYTIGGMLAFYIITNMGLEILKDIFVSSHFYDTDLARVIERKTSMSIDVLETKITEWAHSLVTT